jgi:D-arabinose 1-dehydrogenase-like Zn-dependent alcohol dehydrogenase
MKPEKITAQTVVEFQGPLVEKKFPFTFPEKTQVVVKVHTCGLCHSDLHFHDGHFNLGGGNHLPLEALGVTPPFVLGHEAYGEIVDFGPDSSLSECDKGRFVIIYPWIGCGHCEYCDSGRDHLCGQPQVIGMQKAGGHADHITVPDVKFLVDATGVDRLIAGTFACSGLTSYSALKKLGQTGDNWIGIIGVGGVGMTALSVAKGMGFKKVVVFDVNDDRLEMATKQYGADLAINTQSPDAAEQLLKISSSLVGMIDFVGSPETVDFATKHLQTSGNLIVVGLFGGELKMPLPLIVTKQIGIKGSFVGSITELNELMTYVREGKVKPIPTLEMPIQHVNKAIYELRNGKINGRIILSHS